MRVELPGLYRTKPVYALTDREIGEIARREAEIDVNRAINEWNAARQRRQRARGLAA